MFKALTPILAILVALGLFFTYVQPTFEEIRGMQDEISKYDEAVATAQRLRIRLDELNRERNSISLVNLERLEAFLPDRVNEVGLLVDLDALADAYNLTFGEIQVAAQQAASSQSRRGSDDEDDGGSQGPVYSSAELSFSVSGTYDDFRAFLRQIEQSLVLMEVSSITLAEQEGDLPNFDVTVRVFSLNPISS